MKGISNLFMFVLLLWGISASSVNAQVSRDLIPAIESAESVFLTAVQAYEDQDYETSARLFGVVANTFDLHRKTTAALLMRGKSFYMGQDYVQANQVLTDLVTTYPTSRYVEEAEQLIQFTQEGTNPEYFDTQVIKLGIALPLNEDGSAFTQQLFNGIRMAVEDHNAVSYDSLLGPTRKIQMIFRDTQNQQGAAQEAIRSLATEGVHAIIGPLFSSESLAAAQVAESEGIVMIAPLATDDAVSRDKRFVFQANPTIETRGRLMARYAINGLGINELGILVDYNNSESMRMARAFQQEALTLEANIAFYQTITNSRTWFRLLDVVKKDSLTNADAVYMPFNGGNASSLIGGALSSLDRMGVSSETRLLGNVEWHDISQLSLSSKYSTTYSNDFYANPADSVMLEFQDRYTMQAGAPPERLVYSGYDVTRYLAQQLSRQVVENRPLEFIIRDAMPYQGYGNRLDFSRGNVNEAMFYLQYADGFRNLLPSRNFREVPGR